MSKSRFENDLETAKQFDAIRAEISKMIEIGVQGLDPTLYDDKRDKWVEPGDTVEQAILVDVWGRHSKVSHQKWMDYLETIKEIDVESVFVYTPGQQPKEDHVPVLRAAEVLNTLAAIPTAILSKGALSSLLRLICELYRVPDGDDFPWGVTAGTPQAPQTAFIAWWCIQSVSRFSDTLINTARVAEVVHQTLKQLRQDITPQWISIESRRAASSLSITVQSINTIIDFSAVDFDNPPTIETVVRDQIVRASKAAVQYHEEIKRYQRNRTDIISASALSKLEGLFTALDKIDINLPLDRIADHLRQASANVRECLRPLRRYLRSVLDHELAAGVAQAERIPDAAELLFAADGLAQLQYEDPAHLRSAIERVSGLITNNGRIPSHKPFDVQKKGYVLHVAGNEVVRVFADLCRRSGYPISIDIVQKLLRHLSETWREDAIGWIHERDGANGQCQWWLSGLAITALEALTQLTNARVNSIILSHFSVRQPAKLSITLDSLFFPDYGLVASGVRQRSIGEEFERMRSHVCGVDLKSGGLHSAILHGPPGTGKTTLVEALAKSCSVPLVEITPSDIVLAGIEKIETRARLVFEGLSLLTDAVLLFDEFDSVLGQRDKSATPANIFQFLTPGMLPKLKNLNESAKRQRMAFVLSTNLIGALDKAAIREGRFDAKFGIYPPDVLSRYGRLTRAAIETNISLEPEAQKRLNTVVAKSANGPMTRLAKPGWFSPSKSILSGTPLYYLANGGPEPAFPSPEEERLERQQANDYDKENTSSPLLRSEMKERMLVSELDDIFMNDGLSAVLTQIADLYPRISTMSLTDGTLQDWGHSITSKMPA